MASLTLAGCGQDDERRQDDGRRQDDERRHEPPRSTLATGVQEQNPNLVWSAAARPVPPGGFGPWRDRLAALTPRYYRLFVSWAQAQPRSDRPPDFSLRDAGCLRDVPPCAPYLGVREQLEAIASQQRAQPGAEVLIVLHRTPDWAALPKRGCEPREEEPETRAPGDLDRYRDFVVALARVAQEAGARVRYWSAWNEPNHPGELNPQRERCDTSSPPLAPALYAGLVRAMVEALDAVPGEQEPVVGEVAGYDRPRPTAASTPEFLDALPADVACLGRLWTQHAYVGQSVRAADADYAGDADLRGSPRLLAALERSLDRKGCADRRRIWITETAVGGPSAGKPRPGDPASERAGCRDMHAALLSWYEDPQVDVAFQYTFREDNFFPVGLVDTGLTRAYPAYELWRAWGDREPDDPPPPLPASCR
ncbi:MAG: hypothetical protein ACR2ML_05425 [Solirubrobacteraceae bacterium]